jgi:hypothetical protein
MANAYIKFKIFFNEVVSRVLHMHHPCYLVQNLVIKRGLATWFIPVIPATQEAEVGGSPFKASPGKKVVRPHLSQ